MFKLKRNQVIITVLVVMIAVAGYLNYQGQNPLAVPEGFTYNPDGTIGALIADLPELEIVAVDGVIATLSPMSEDAMADEDTTALSDSAFFVNARIRREQDRANQSALLLALIDNDNTTAEIRQESAEHMLTIQHRIEKESAAEALIESRGFNEVYVRIGDNSVDVIVNKETLTESELAQIEDVIKRKVGADAGTIRISPMRAANS